MIAPISPVFGFSYEYGDELADHLPMTLSALRRLGATEARREVFARRYVVEKALRKLDPASAEAHARSALVARIARDGRDVVLRSELHELARGLGGGAFHALIRVAYAIADRDDVDLAAGLAYWRHAYLDLGEISRPNVDEEATGATPFDVDDALANARAILRDVPARLDDGALIAHRMAMVAREPAFESVVDDARVRARDLPLIASTAVRGFAATRSFTMLHAMTATHAIRVLLPYASDADTTVRYLWRAFVAAYTSAGLPEIPTETALLQHDAEAPTWEALGARACSSDDEHVIKAAFTAREEDRAYASPSYRVAVARYLKLI